MIMQSIDSESMLSTGVMRTGAAEQIYTPNLVPMQSFSLSTEGTTQKELSRQLQYTFYKTVLACGEGLVYTVDKTDSAAFAGMPMCRQLNNTHSVVLGSPLLDIERQKLRVLGALQSLFVLSAPQAIANLPPFMTLGLQQRMKMCPVRQQLAPLTPSAWRGPVESRSAARILALVRGKIQTRAQRIAPTLEFRIVLS